MFGLNPNVSFGLHYYIFYSLLDLNYFLSLNTPFSYYYLLNSQVILFLLLNTINEAGYLFNVVFLDPLSTRPEYS